LDLHFNLIGAGHIRRQRCAGILIIHRIVIRQGSYGTGRELGIIVQQRKDHAGDLIGVSGDGW